MARRRMFSLDVVDTDAFLDLPCSSQALYFHLGMRADDDGFVSSPKRVTSIANASVDDLKLLAAKGFVIPFDSGVCVIRDWRRNNYIQSDRRTATTFTEEMKRLQISENRAYSLMDTGCIQVVSNLDTQNRLDKFSLVLLGDIQSANDESLSQCDTDVTDEESENFTWNQKLKNTSEEPTPPAENINQTKPTHFVPPSVEDVRAYCRERHNGVDAQAFVDFYEASGWMRGKTKLKDWRAAVRTWERNGNNRQSAQPQQPKSTRVMKEY